MNKQEILNTVYKHLKTQGEPAIDSEGVCTYRTYSGLKCAIGCLIPDNIYNPVFEGRGVIALYKENLLEPIFPGITEEEIAFLHRMQEIHDSFFDTLDEKFKTLCEDYDLEFPSE